MTVPSVSSVPRVAALTVEEAKTSGRTLPVVMLCAPIAGAADRYVVKLSGSVELGARSLARELFAALLASLLGLRVPDPAVVELSECVARACVDADMRGRLQRSVGPNYGSKLLSPAYIYHALPDDQTEAAADVFAFDVLLQNLDRRKGKPNLFQNPEGLVVFDHEMGFPYADPTMMIGGASAPWDLGRGDTLFTNHILFQPLRRRANAVRFNQFIERLTQLTDDLLAEIVSQIPTEWTSAERPEMRNICAFVGRVRDNAARFERCLLEVLA